MVNQLTQKIEEIKKGCNKEYKDGLPLKCGWRASSEEGWQDIVCLCPSCKSSLKATIETAIICLSEEKEFLWNHIWESTLCEDNKRQINNRTKQLSTEIEELKQRAKK